MAFLDFIKDRKASQPQAGAPKPQERPLGNARELFRREAAQRRTQLKPEEQIPEANKAAVTSLRERVGQAQPVANAQQQPAESATEQATPDRVLESLKSAQGSKLSPTPNQETDGIDPARLARAERFVDASARPKREEPPPMRWPRPRSSWER